MLGEDVEFEPEWLSVYTFRCRRMRDFIYRDRVLFMGDAAHQVSPFGARGANGAVQSVENLCWKLKRVLSGEAPPALLVTYNLERSHGADENLLNSTRTADFITPKNHISHVFRDEVLRLAADHPFARPLINSGRLSCPCTLDGSPLNTPDADDFRPQMRPGAVCRDAPVLTDGRPDWLLRHLGNRFTLMVCGGEAERRALASFPAIADLQLLTIGFDCHCALPGTRIDDVRRFMQSAYQLRPGTCYLIRPDQHVCARWRRLDLASVSTAMARALGRSLHSHGAAA